MSFMDSILEFWDAQALTVQEESRTNGDMFDMETDGANDAQMGFLWWNLTVSTVPTGMASGGYFQLVTSDSETFATGGGGEQVIGAFGSAENPLFIAQLPAGAKFSLSVPLRVLHKYVEAEWIPVSEAAGAMVVDSWMGMEPVGPLNTQKEPT
jgi:hypothetical protein